MDLRVHLSIFGLHPSVVSEALGLPPTKMYIAGTTLGNGKIVEYHTWSFTPPIPRDRGDFDAHVAAIFSLVSVDDLLKLLLVEPEASIQLGCSMRFDARYPVGIGVNAENITKLGLLNCSLDLDLYPDDGVVEIGGKR
jgi:hypothetical protein